MSKIKKTLQTAALIPVATTTLVGSLGAQTLTPVNPTQINPTSIDLIKLNNVACKDMTLQNFFYNASKEDFREKYFDNLDLLKQDFNIDSTTFAKISTIDLDQLSNIYGIEIDDGIGDIGGENKWEHTNNVDVHSKGHSKITFIEADEKLKWEDMLGPYINGTNLSLEEYLQSLIDNPPATMCKSDVYFKFK